MSNTIELTREKLTAKQAKQFNDAAQMCITHLQFELKLLVDYHAHVELIQNSIVEGQGEIPEEKRNEEERLRVLEQSVMKSRESMVNELASLCGVEPHCVSIKHFAQLVAPELESQIDSIKEEIIETTEKISAANQLNYLLIQQTVDLQKKLHTVLSGGTLAPQTYSADGRAQRESKRSMFEADC